MGSDIWAAGLLSGFSGAVLGALVTWLVSLLRWRHLRHSVDLHIQQVADREIHRVGTQCAAQAQDWYGTAEWQAGETEADEDRACGRSTVLTSDEELDRFLASRYTVASA